MAGILMNIKKIIIIIIFAATLFTIAILIFTNISFFKEIPPVGPEQKEMPAAVEEAAPAHAIPSNAIPAGQMIKDIISRNIEKQKTLEERELEAERVRNANRAEAFARQKKLEAYLIHAETHAPKKAAVPALPQKEPGLPSDEEMKAMEKKGIISY